MIMTWQKFKGNTNRMHQFGGPMILKSSGHWLCMRIVHWLMFKLCFVSSVKIPLCIQTEAEKKKLSYKVVQQFMERCTKRIKRRISISLTAITKCVNHYRIHFAFNEVNRNLAKLLVNTVIISFVNDTIVLLFVMRLVVGMICWKRQLSFELLSAM